MEYPPSSGYLNEYGGEFADFLAALPTASALRYLPDVARFEWALSSAANAADAPMLDVVALAEVDPDQQGSIRFQPHPSAQGRDLISVVLTMLSFGIGAALPLLLLGLVSREAIAKWCNRLLNAGQRGKAALGAIAGFAGLMILTGSDRPLEAVIVAASPDWLIRLTTSF
jgi:hypothetical protein